MLGNDSAIYGGGAYAGTNRNCLVEGNTALLGAGACLGLVQNCTVVHNLGTVSGGTDSTTLENSIVYDNSGGNYAACSISYTCTAPLASGTGNITNEPVFLPGGYRLHPLSPGIDMAISNTWMQGSTDLASTPRIVGDSPDMGCYEYQTRLDLCVVLDFSSSMGSDEAAGRDRAGSRLVNACSMLDRLGILATSNRVGVIAAPALVLDESARNTMKTSLADASSASGDVLGAAVPAALDLLFSPVADGQTRAILFCTDANADEVGDVDIDSVPVDVALHATIPAAGSDWQHELQSWLVQRRPGIYSVVPTPVAEATVARRTIVGSHEVTVVPGQSHTNRIVVDDAVASVDFRVGWGLDDPSPAISVATPAGLHIMETNVAQYAGVTWTSSVASVVCSVVTPTNGEWSVVVTSAVPQVVDVSALVESELGAGLWLDNVQYAAGTDVVLTAVTTDLATNVVVYLTNAWGSTEYTVLLYDDGSHGDGGSGDGIYAGAFTNATSGGQNWRATLCVQGKTDEGHPFERYSELAFYVVGGRDQLDCPTGMVAHAQLDFSSVRVEWSGVGTGVKYDLFRSLTGNAWDEKLIYSGAATEYLDTAAAVGVENCYTVRAYAEGRLDSVRSATVMVAP